MPRHAPLALALCAFLTWLGSIALGQGRDAPKPVTLDVERAPLAQVLRRLAAENGLNFVADLRVLERAGDITIAFRDVPFDEAIATLGEVYDLEVRLRGTILFVRAHPETPVPRPVEAPRGTRSEPWKALPKPEPRTDAKPTPEAPAAREEPAHVDSTSAAAKHQDPKGPAPAPGATPGITVGIVVEVDASHVRLKERSGAVRDFHAPKTGDRGARIASALRGLKRGDQCGLTFDEEEGGRAVISNFVGGPARAAFVPEGGG